MLNKEPDFSSLPGSTGEQVRLWWTDLIAQQEVVSALGDDILTSLPSVWLGSEYVAKACLQHPEEFVELTGSGDLGRSYSDVQLSNALQEKLLSITSAEQLSRQLRIFRRREMVRIIWRDLAGWSELVETCRDLSLLAEACLEHSLSFLYTQLCEELGTPQNEAGEQQYMVVLGMGKLGAWELNLSSDIDLIFTYPDSGETVGGSKVLSNSEFFTRLGKQLITAIDQQTADGYVFRVDMRLRPFGEGGALVSSFAAFENYYQVHGRSWERYAMIKARVVAGDKEAGKYLMDMLQPFIYRRYMDYDAYESLREMKAMIAQQVKHKGMQQNVKLGAGGIREVEFIAQVFQMIRGGREHELRERRLLLVLDRLAEKQQLPEYVVNELKEAYVFLRNTEHRIQAYQDKQLHSLPADETGQSRLAFSMGFENWAIFLQHLEIHRKRVQDHFEQVFVAPQTEDSSEQESEFQMLEAIWYNKLDEETSIATLSTMGFKDPAACIKKLQTFHKSNQYRTLSRQGQTRLDRLIPLLLGAVTHAEQVDVTFERVLALFSNIARRSVYLALLLESPLVLSQLIKLCAASSWLARYLQQHPILLDELINPAVLYTPPGKQEMETELRNRLGNIDLNDVELGMDVLRHFKHTNILRVAAADVADALPLMKVSDHLTWIAEVVLDEALEQAWRHLVQRHGRPVCRLDESGSGQLCDKGFAVVGYGKLGGYELGYGSDLDMVFLHGGESNNLMTVADEKRGEKALAVPVFFARLGQRIIHLLTAATSAGVLYEADMRLRPDGASGLLVSNLKAYKEYQTKKAWLWEHQALVRARVVCGDPLIAEQFKQIRHEILTQQRDRYALQKEVVDMRNRMRNELCKQKTGEFDLKQGPGGIVDIEFMVQYGVLAWAHEYPDLLTYTDNIRILEALARAGLMEENDAELLSDAYRTYRSKLHKMALLEIPGIVNAADYQQMSGSVQKIWQQWLEKE